MKDIFGSRRRRKYVAEMLELYNKFSGAYDSRNGADSCDKWIFSVKRNTSKSGTESNNNGCLWNIGSPRGSPVIWCGLL